jgi:hypothetical protein
MIDFIYMNLISIGYLDLKGLNILGLDFRWM